MAPAPAAACRKPEHTAIPIPRSSSETELAEIVASADAVIHLAGEPVAQRWTEAVEETHYDSRVDGTRRLVDALSKRSPRPRVLICASAVGYYGSRGDQILTEASSPGDDFLAGVVVEWEDAAQAAESLGIRVVRLRFGMVLGQGRRAGQTASSVPLRRRRAAGLRPPMDGLDSPGDVVNLILRAVTFTTIRGAVNATAPHPVTNQGVHRQAGARASPAGYYSCSGFCLKAGFRRNVGDAARQPTRASHRGEILRFPLPISGITEGAGESAVLLNLRDNTSGMRFLLVLVTAAVLTAAAEMNLTVAQLVMFIRSSVQLKQPDRQVAEYLRHVKLKDKLEDRTIEDLQSLGAGPKTVAALRELGEASAELDGAPPPPPPPVYVPPPPPNSEEQAKIIDEAREYSLNYTKQLPNFICVQVTRRDYDPTGTGNNWY